MVHHTVEAGITLASGVQRVEVEDVVVADNLVGIALLPATGEVAGTAEVKNVVVIGNSDNGGCGYDLDIECQDRSEERETGVGSRTGGSGSPGGQALLSGCGHRYAFLQIARLDVVNHFAPISEDRHIWYAARSCLR